MYRIYSLPEGEKVNERIKLSVENTPVPLREARVSAYPFNRRWPGHQRTMDQSETVTFASFETDEPVKVTVNPGKEFSRVTVRPLSKNIKAEIADGSVSFIIPCAGYYTVEFDGMSEAVHIFADKPCRETILTDSPDVLFFGPGVHDAGCIELKSGQTLYIDECAVVYGRVYAKDAENIRITGRGILDNGKEKETILYEAADGDGTFALTNERRNDTVLLEYCSDVKIDSITIRDSLVYNIRPVACERLTIEDVKVIGCWRYNSDGFDMHNCRDVVIRNCFLRTYDDCICAKGFDYRQNEDDMQHNGKLYDVFDGLLVEKCVIWNDWGVALEIGAETRAKAIRNIVFRDIDIIHGTHVMLGISNADFAEVSDILYDDIRVEYDGGAYRPELQRSDGQAFSFDRDCGHQPELMNFSIWYSREYSRDKDIRGLIHDITCRNISVTADKMPASRFSGYDENARVSGVTVENLTLNGTHVSAEDATISYNFFAEEARVGYRQERISTL